jgi:hypothetical protein
MTKGTSLLQDLVRTDRYHNMTDLHELATTGTDIEGLAQRRPTAAPRAYRFLSTFHFHILPSNLFLSPFRSSGILSSSTHCLSLIFLTAPLPIRPFVVPSLASA